MEHQTVNNSQNTINSVNRQKNNPTEILRLDYQLTDKKQDDKCNTDRPYITGKTLRLPAEIKKAEHHHRTKHRINQSRFNKGYHFCINISQCS